MLTLHMLTFLAPLFAAAGAAPAASRAPALPRYFEENCGQAGPGVRFLARGRDYVAAIVGEGAGRGYFHDVPSSHPYFPYIQKLKEFGITGGLTATTYWPDQPITRGQMGVFLIRAFAAAR